MPGLSHVRRRRWSLSAVLATLMLTVAVSGCDDDRWGSGGAPATDRELAQVFKAANCDELGTFLEGVSVIADSGQMADYTTAMLGAIEERAGQLQCALP